MKTPQNTFSSDQNLNTLLKEQQTQDMFGKKVAAHLSAGQADIHHDISERLRVARQMAVAKRKRAAIVKTTGAVFTGRGGTASMSFDDEHLSWWNRIASFLPLLALVAGLITIAEFQSTQRAYDAAELDADILTDALPASAYADPGFAQFLKINVEAGIHTEQDGQLKPTPLPSTEMGKLQEI